MTTFNDLGLAEPLLRALADEGYTSPTPIQAQAIPPALAGHDLLGIAQTGTGKTAAFALPILNRLAENPAPRRKCATRVLVLAPTRELATQIADSFRSYARYQKLTVMTVFGGVPIPRQEKQLASGVDVLVATPGRLLDLIDRRALLLDTVEVLVLDEADQMLDLGFIHSLKRIAGLLPRRRQSLFFSATMPKTIAELAGRFLTDPVQVAVAPVSTTAERVEQFVTFLNQAEKQALLTMTLRQPEFAKALVFTRTKHGADRVVRHLAGAGIPSAAIHGNKSQPQRERALAAFRDGDIGVLVATDIAARGIDIDSVSHVINFELPNVPEQYVHRIGRTARAGRDGVAVSFCAPDEKAYLKDIEKLTRQKVAPVPLPTNFVAEAEKLPKPVADTRGERPERARRGEVGRHRDAARPFGEKRSGAGENAGQRPRGHASRGAGGPPPQNRFGGKPGQGRFAGGAQRSGGGNRATSGR
ncbi:MAG: DEAD/DEAH box helicase [Sphingomonadaceae bacterium]